MNEHKQEPELEREQNENQWKNTEKVRSQLLPTKAYFGSYFYHVMSFHVKSLQHKTLISLQNSIKKGHSHERVFLLLMHFSSSCS